MPVSKLVSKLRAEAHRPRAVYQAHKWFARRIGASFRALLVGAEATTEKEFWSLFKRGKSKKPLTTLDPFVGGGTSVVEAALLGHIATGVDIDPVACAVTSFEARLAALPDLDPFITKVRKEVESKLREFYQSRAPSGQMETILHTFWVQVVACPYCGKKTDAHPDRVLAQDKDRRLQWVIAPSGAIIEAPLATDSVIDPASKQPFAFDEGASKGGAFTCPHCLESARLIDIANGEERPPVWRPFAIEVLDSTWTHKRVPMARRFFRAVSEADIAVFKKAEAKLDALKVNGSIPYIPEATIPAQNRSDDRVIKYGYRRYRQMFNPRQLLHLSLLAESISELPAGVREAFSMAFSDHLATNCMLTSYASGWRRLLPLFTFRAFTHSVRPVEINPWLDGNGRGTFMNALRSVQRASRSFREELSGGDNYQEEMMPPIRVERGKAQKLSFAGDESIDLVLTDPPYFDNIAYSELSHFYLPWLRMLGIVPKGSDQFLYQSLATNTRGAKDQERFSSGLVECFAEIRRVLKRNGRLIFTFQHHSFRAWTAVAEALRSNDFEALDVFPMFGDGGNSPHKHEGSSSWDAVFVVRKRQRVARTAEDWIERANAHAEAWSHFLARKRFNKADRQNFQKAALAAAYTTATARRDLRAILTASLSEH